MPTNKHDWKSEWRDMPEFVQEPQRPYAKIIVRFESEADLQDFATRIGQKLNSKTKSIWHPHKPHCKPKGNKLAWIVENDAEQ